MDWRWLFTSFEGRINRAKFWAGIIVLWALSIVVNSIIAIAFDWQYRPGWFFPVMEPAGRLVWIAVAIPIVFAALAVLAKRWHDRDKSGWWSLIGFVPFVGFIWIVIECGCLPGTEGPNRYGPDPLAGDL
jgi:uncharacterized membrane protein YhaH (DUF805 family)